MRNSNLQKSVITYDAVYSNVSTSVGRKYRGSTNTSLFPSFSLERLGKSSEDEGTPVTKPASSTPLPSQASLTPTSSKACSQNSSTGCCSPMAMTKSSGEKRSSPLNTMHLIALFVTVHRFKGSLFKGSVGFDLSLFTNIPLPAPLCQDIPNWSRIYIVIPIIMCQQHAPSSFPLPTSK